MNTIKKPDGLPDCKIIDTLIEKANSKTDYDFNYIHQLDEIRNRISIEVSRINLLFPEYTPHDEKYHLKRLFFVADHMLGDDIIENMNVTELFLLSVSLYAHDWGMAISENEKTHILSCQKDAPTSDINLLDDENIRIKEFCENKNIEIEKIEIEDWREYVRLTHAFRSGKRIKTYFDSISSGVAEFASRICEGHWLGFDIIDDYTSYPTDASIHSENVNVKALTIYVRLIDLLDMGEDRTPYVLWKFVAPRNQYSKMEWAKHRALQSVTFPQYQLTRYILVDGSTDDQNVFMSIMDLKRYADDQFRQCSDILNRINHNYHKLNISHIEWRIAARGFEPVAIQFEFDRNRMFDILGDEIYQGNPFVFIRELLQNAIDAIEMRTEILEKKDLSFKPKIKVEVTEDTLNYIVQITDNGIGMDEYIIRNYLTVAGKSYYRSVDFQKERLKMDPISRFGIGVLSCFMIADYIEIDTFKDPNTTKKQEYLKISIPSKENYFKIRKNIETLEIGTTFRVFVVKKRLPKDDKTKSIINFNITEYIRKTAGFVKYPMSIIENGIESIIHYPNIEEPKEASVIMMDYKFPIEKVIQPQNIETVKEYFEEKTFHLKTDLNLADFDGCITFLLPKDETVDIISSGHSWPLNEVKLINYKINAYEHKKIKWNDTWARYSTFYNKDRFIIPERYYSVFMDGILIQEITPPSFDLYRKDEDDDDENDIYYSNSLYDSFIIPQFIVNIPKPSGMKIDLARTNIKSAVSWDYPIWKAFFEYLKVNQVNEIVSKEPNERLMALARLITFYNISEKSIIEHLIDKSKFPLPFISNHGTVIFHEYGCDNFEYIRMAPSQFSGEYFKLIKANYFEYEKYDGILKYWKGPEAIIETKDIRFFNEAVISFSNIERLTKYFFSRNYYFSSIEFVTSPLGKNFPLVEEIYKIRPNTTITLAVASVITNFNLGSIDDYDFSILNALLKRKFDNFPRITKFPDPYNSKLFYSFEYLNINNALAKLIISICLSLIKAIDGKNISTEITGKLFDMINELPFIKSHYSSIKKNNIIDINSQLNTVFSEASRYNIIESDINLKSEIKLTDFVENSISINKKTKLFSTFFEIEKYKKSTLEWGEVIK